MIPSIRKGTGQKRSMYQPLPNLLKACVLLFWITDAHDTSYNKKKKRKEKDFRSTFSHNYTITISGRKKSIYCLFIPAQILPLFT